ncbi:DUF3144 domain-containing protein [Azomonas macrocytogenes]|uniref:DUF3144 domain-containing protein n=1 Tax=Azomonas macrocytogenes TaxID=69962 RepID=A0A839SZ81_AZOMA|nr:DUF3144 domain-containing protein [Azomonas macrocytogenes]MBB3101989.1 hypothetical protein [Azomonas macrocytogenes]
MSDNQDNTIIFNMADEFIEIANRLVGNEKKDLGHVSTAFRYAAARFSVHEASCKFNDLPNEQEKLQKWYTNQFDAMLQENFEDHIERLGQNFIVEMSGD